MVKIFYSYSHDDKKLRDKLDKHLHYLKRKSIITWYDKEITPGHQLDKAIEKELSEADLILLLISSSFISSFYCYEIEMKKAMERHELEEAVVLPVLLRDCVWKNEPFAKLLMTPDDAKPINNKRYWYTTDEALTNVAKDVERTVNLILSTKGKKNKTTEILPNDSKPEEILSSGLIKKEFVEKWFSELSIEFEIIERAIIHFSKTKLQRAFYEFEEKETLLAVIKNNKKIVILGDAGTGKSTELKKLYNNFKDITEPIIPIYQSLNTYTPEKGLENFLPEYWNSIPQELLLIIWDGLDEIQQEHFNSIVRQINSFATKYDKVRIVVSCRTNFYEYPNDDSTGTLNNFEPFLIDDITISDAKIFYEQKYNQTNGKSFIEDAYENNFLDLLSKPYFLNLLAESYSNNNSLSISKTELYEQSLLSQIEIDKNHFKINEIREKKLEIIKLLEKVALSMEILTNNFIKESDLLNIITSKEFKLLKYCGVFTKKKGEEEIWQFTHNNIQEYLAAKTLSKLNIDKVLKFITFNSITKKIIPSWVNTLTFLFSLLRKNEELYVKLLEWIIKNDKEIIIKFESNKIDENIRINIFKGIFEYYKDFDIWISSSQFRPKELAKFGQSKECFKYLISELKDEKNSKTILQSALILVGNFDNKINRKDLKGIVLKLIDKNNNDPHFVNNAINCLEDAKINDKQTIKELMELIGESKNQFIRASVYSILLTSNVLEQYIDYIIEGYKLLNNKQDSDRDSITSYAEGFKVKECIKNIKSSKGIKKIFESIISYPNFESSYDSDKVLNAIFENTIVAFKEDIKLFNTVFEWYLKEIMEFRRNEILYALEFFELTKTTKQAFNKIWELKDDVYRTKLFAVACLLNSELTSIVIDKYNNEEIKYKELNDIVVQLSWSGNSLKDILINLIQEKTDYKVELPEQINYDKIRNEKLQADYNILFDKEKFQNEILRIFDEENKIKFSENELYELRKEKNTLVELEDFYSGVALRLLKDFTPKGFSINKEEIIEWFKKNENELWQRISYIYDYNTNYKSISTNENQKKYIENWCTKNVAKVDFKNALTIHADGGYTVNRMAIYIRYFSTKYNFTFSEKTLLDMLSFVFATNDEDEKDFKYLVSKLDNDKIIIRMNQNIKQGINYHFVLKNHIKFLLANNSDKSLKYIINAIIDLKKEEYYRNEYLDILYEHTKSSQILKKILLMCDDKIRWKVISKLMQNNEEKYVSNYLVKFINTNRSDSEKFKAAEQLIVLQNIFGLQFYLKWFKNNTENSISINSASCLDSIQNIDTLPLLIELLEISYKQNIVVDRFDNFNSHVISGITNIGIVSAENLNLVKLSLMKFVEDYSLLHENVKYLLHTIERMESRYYSNLSKSYSIKEVNEKLKLLN